MHQTRNTCCVKRSFGKFSHQKFTAFAHKKHSIFSQVILNVFTPSTHTNSRRSHQKSLHFFANKFTAFALKKIAAFFVSKSTVFYTKNHGVFFANKDTVYEKIH